jgi:hypothetical protein
MPMYANEIATQSPDCKGSVSVSISPVAVSHTISFLDTSLFSVLSSACLNILPSHPNKSVCSKKANEINTPESIQSAVSIGSITTKPKQKKIIAFNKLD